MSQVPDLDFTVDFPTLCVALDWIEAHCVIPDGKRAGEPFEMYPWQLYCSANHYRVKPTAKPGDEGTAAFHNRRSQIVAPQKTGKGPWSAAGICLEAVGPATFLDWAEGGEAYDCADHGCSCGWGYEYANGEPMGKPWATPLIQLLAKSIEQTDNIYRPLQAMVRQGPLGEQMRVGEGFIRIPNGRIDPVTSAADSKLGAPVTYVAQDETGLYTKQNGMIGTAQTQRRGLAGMSGRSQETTNPWDPSVNSLAQRTYESRRPDIFKFYREPPRSLGSYMNKADRRKIHAFAYRGSDHVDLNSIEAEAAELIETDPAQAERFFGNRLVQGAGAWLPEGLWSGAYAAGMAT